MSDLEAKTAEIQKSHELQRTLDVLKITQDRARLNALWNQAFATGTQHDYTNDFPVWIADRLEKSGQLALIGVRQGDDILSAAGVRLGRMRVPSGSLTIALIGGVATAASARGQGLASHCVSVAAQWARERGAALAVLWGSEHDLYRKIGFELCGEQIRVPISALLPDALAFGAEPITVQRGWTPGLMLPLLRRRGGLALEAADEDWVASHKSVRWYWTGSRERPSAYAAYGRGIDLQHLVHELGGPRGELWAILREIAKDDPDAQILGHPQILAQQLRIDTASLEREFLGMASIFDPVALLRAFYPLARIQTQPGNEGTNLSIDGVEISNLSESELARFLLGPGSPQSPIGGVQLPLPVWIWGLDAV